MPTFRVKKQVFEWIRTGQKTIELRKGEPRKGNTIAFLNGQGQFLRGQILDVRKGKIDDLLCEVTYRQIVPTARTLNEAAAFIKQIYKATDGIFVTYKFRLLRES